MAIGFRMKSRRALFPWATSPRLRGWEMLKNPEILQRPAIYSRLMLATRTTLPHFLVSSEMSLRKSAGELASTVPPRLFCLRVVRLLPGFFCHHVGDRNSVLTHGPSHEPPNSLI